MSWLGLRHKGVEILYPHEWNAVVDGLDILYAYVGRLEQETVKVSDLQALESDVSPAVDNTYDLGEPDRRWREVRGVYGYFDGDLYARGSRVLVDGDPVQVYRFIDEAKTDIDTIKEQTSRPTVLDTMRLTVGTTPVPLSDVELAVKRIHVKVPSWALYLVYLGSEQKQDFILEPGDTLDLEIVNPRNVYVRSLGQVEIFIAFEE